MKTAKELYTHEYSNSESYFSAYDYDPMLQEFGIILVKVDDNDYQGDSRVLYEKDGKYGWLQFGWGSCSGCDSLQACDTAEEVDELMASLLDSIKWFDSKEECVAFFTTHDWGGDYSYHNEEQSDFIKQVIQYFVDKEN